MRATSSLVWRVMKDMACTLGIGAALVSVGGTLFRVPGPELFIGVGIALFVRCAYAAAVRLCLRDVRSALVALLLPMAFFAAGCVALPGAAGIAFGLAVETVRAYGGIAASLAIMATVLLVRDADGRDESVGRSLVILAFVTLPIAAAAYVLHDAGEHPLALMVPIPVIALALLSGLLAELWGAMLTHVRRLCAGLLANATRRRTA